MQHCRDVMQSGVLHQICLCESKHWGGLHFFGASVKPAATYSAIQGCCSDSTPERPAGAE